MNWTALKKLRELFLSDYKDKPSYWESTELLKDYDETFAARIGWKWDSVLSENASLSLPENYTLVDWGAGTGIATRKFLSHFPKHLPKEILFIEKSVLAQQFAKSQIQVSHPTLPVTATNTISATPSIFVLLISHVLTELPHAVQRELIALAEKAEVLIWVEPGTLDCSKRLVEVRKKLLAHSQIIAPCTHDQACPLGEKDWCHHFAKVPSEAFTTAHWKTFSTEMGIDLRSLPTSYLVMSKREKTQHQSLKRVLGRIRSYKGYALVQGCGENGIEDIKLLEKIEKKKIKELKNTPFSYFVD